jgi:hypothetical protein
MWSRWILTSPSNHQRGPRPPAGPFLPKWILTPLPNHQRGPRPLQAPSAQVDLDLPL